MLHQAEEEFEIFLDDCVEEKISGVCLLGSCYTDKNDQSTALKNVYLAVDSLKMRFFVTLSFPS